MGLTTVIRDYGTEILNAIRENDIQKLKLILEKTLRSDAKIAKLCVTDIKHKPTKKFACPLILAARQEDPRIMKYMMDKGTDPNFVHHTIFSSKRREIVTALHLAVDLGHYDTVEVLLNANGDANIYDHNKETPLHIAVKKADHMMVKLLLSKGADPLIPDNKNNAALHIATLYGHLQMVRTLLKYDADIYQKGQWETVPPLIAAKEGHTHLVQLFSANDLSIINVKIPCYLDRREKAQIHLAAENGHAECLSVLLEEFDADVNLKDSDGNTALHSIVLHPYDVHRMRDKEYFTQSARLLLKFRVSINEKNIFGDTALHFAAMNHYHRIVELLLDNGANPFLENEDGMKPIDTVPDSDPVTKQILKMAMKKGRPPFSIGSTAHRRVADGSINNTTLQDSILLDQSRSNISYRSASSSSSVFIDETRQHRSHRSRDADGRHSHSRSKSKLPEVIETPSTENEPSQEQGICQRTENEIAVYSKVNKKKLKQRPTEGKQTDLGYDQQEWEIISTATMNEESVQGSVISLHDKDKSSTERRASSQRRNHQQQSYLAELANDDKQQDYIDKKNRINKHQKPSSVTGDLSLDTAIPQPGDEAQPQRVGQTGEIIYENIPPLVTEEAPPLPPRKNRPTTNLDEQMRDEQEPMESTEKSGVKVHTVPGRPSAIEVQYEGGPITISVETPQVPTDHTKSGETISSRSSKHKRYSASSPQQHRKQSASPKIKRKHDIDLPAGQLYNEGVNQQMAEEISTRKKHSPQRHKNGSDNYTSGSVQEYSADYYQKKALKKKKKSKQNAEEVSDPTAHREQRVDDYLSGSYDISELESLQQSMISESSQPELVRRIIQQKIADLLEQKAREAEKHEKSKDKMKQWLIETDEQDEETEEDEDDEEHILDSDVWSDDEEFQTPGEWLGTKDDDDSDDHYDDHESGNDIERQLRKVETKSTSVKQQYVSQQQVSEQTQKEMHRPKDVEVNLEEISSNSTRKGPAKSLQKIKIDKESTQEFIPSEQTEYDKDGNAISVKSPGSMTFQEKLAWAKAKEKRQAKLDTPTKHQVANTENISIQEANVALVVDEKQKQQQKSKGTDGLASGIRDQMKLTDHHGEYYSLTHGIDSSSTSTSTDISTAVSKQSEKGFQNVKEAQIHVEEQVTMEVEEYEGSPFSRRKAKDIKSTVDIKVESTRQRSKSQNDIIDVHQDERSVSPVTLKDIPKHGLRTASVLSEGTGLGLRVSGQVPKAYTHSEKGAARRAFMLANPVKIESSSECSDSELHGSRGSVSEVSGRKDRGKLWEEPMLKPVYPKHSSGLTSSTPTSDAEISPRSNSENTKKDTKIIGGYTKPYKSFGKIEVNTDLIEEAMLNASIPEDPETASDLEPYAVSDIEEDVKVETVKGRSTHTDSITLPPKVQPEPEMESEVMKYEDFRFEALDKEPEGTRFVRQESGEGKEISKHPPPLPFNSPPVTKLEEPQLSPRSDTSSKSSRKVVSVKENLRNEHGDMIEMITTTVIKHEVPQAEVAVRETVAPTDDLSFGDSTFDDLDELVLQNMQVNAPSELPPPPPELMNTSGSQELLNSLADKSNKITVHAEQVGANEEVCLMKSSKLKKKSKKSTENLAGAAELEQKKKKKKKKKLKTAESDKKKTEDIQVEDTPREDIDLEKYDQEPGLIKPKKVKGIATVLALADGIPLKPSEVKSLQDASGQVKLRQDTRHKRDGTADEELNEQNEELKDYNNEGNESEKKKYQYREEEQIRQQRTAETDDTAESKATGKQRLQTDVNQSMTDIEVAQITDAAEARRKAREAARAQRLWHKKMIEEGKDPRLVLKSRSHSRETSDDQRNQSPSPTRKRAMPSPDSYSITVEGNAEVTTSQGMRLSVRSQKAHDEQKQEESLGDKKSKKKKIKKSTESLPQEGTTEKKKKLGKTDDSSENLGAKDGLVGGKKKKKKKKKKSGELVSVVTPNMDDLAPKGTVQGAPPETVISDIWKEAMEGQPLASSETVYEEQPLDGNSEVRRSRRGRKPKRSSNDNRPQPIMQINLQESLEDQYADDVTTEPSLQGLIRPATVPDVNRPDDAHYDSSTEDDLEKESENILSVELTAAERAEMEARKKQQKLIRLGRKYKLVDGGLVHDEQHQQEQERKTIDDKSPKPTKQPHKKVGLQHAIELQQAEEHSSEGSVDEPLPGSFVRRADVPNIIPARQPSYETNLDDSPVSDLDENVKVAAMNLTEAQRKAIMTAREAKKQLYIDEKAGTQLIQQSMNYKSETCDINEDMLPTNYQDITKQRQKNEHMFRIQLHQNVDDTVLETDDLTQDFIKRAAVPEFRTEQKSSYETNLDDSDELTITEQIQTEITTDVQQAELRKAKEVRRLQQSLDKIAKKREKNDEPQQKISQERKEMTGDSKQKYAIQLTQKQDYAIENDYNDDDSSLSENISRRVTIPAGCVGQKFEINQEDSDGDEEDEHNVLTVSLSEAQRNAKLKAVEEKKQEKAQERRERTKQKQKQYITDTEGTTIEVIQGGINKSPDEEPIHDNFVPQVGPGDLQNARVTKAEEISSHQVLQKNIQIKPERGQQLDEEGYLIPQPSHDKPSKSHSAVRLKQPYQNEDEYLEITEPMSDYIFRKVKAPNLPPRPSFDTEIDDLQIEGNDYSELTLMSKKSGDLTQDDTSDQRMLFTRSTSGRTQIKRGTQPKVSQGNENFIDRDPELLGEDALPPDGNTDAQLQQELARLREGRENTTPLMSELWQEKKEQEDEMKLMLESVQDPTDLEPHSSRQGRLPPPPTEPLPVEETAERSAMRDLSKVEHKQSPAGSSYKPPKAPVKVDRRPPRGPHMGDSPHLSQGESPHTSMEISGRPRSHSEGKQYDQRARAGSEGRSPKHMQPVKRRIRRAYPSDGELYAGHQSDSEAVRKSRRVKSISFYGDFRKGAAEKRDRPPKITASQSLEEVAWQQIRHDMEKQSELRPHRVIKPHGDKPINYTRGIYRPVPVYWRGSQRSFINTSRYDDSELIDQLWNERHRSMTTESEGDADMEDVSYDVNMPEAHESDQFGTDQIRSYGQSVSDDEHIRLSQYSSPSNVPPSELPHEQYFGAFQPVGPAKKVTIVDKKHRTSHKDHKDLPPRFMDPGPVDFKNYGAAAKLWMEQVDRTQTQKSKTMYLAMMGDQQPPPEIIQGLAEDETGDGSVGSQWVIARGRSLRRAKHYYNQQKQMEGGAVQDQESLDPGKQMLLFFKIGENWKDLAWILFDGLQSDGDTLRMLKEIQHRHPDKINDQVHDMMHRWWKKKGSAATIEELQRGLEVLKMAYVEEEYVNTRGVFSETETELDASTASEDDAEVNRLIHDYKTRSLNASFENRIAQNAAVQLNTPESNSTLNTDSLLRKLEEAAIDNRPAKINRSSITRSSPQPPSKPKHEDSHGESDYDSSADGTHRHSFVIIQPQLNSKEYKHETNM